MAYNSPHTGPQIDAAVEMLGQVQQAQASTSKDLAEVKVLAAAVKADAHQVVTNLELSIYAYERTVAPGDKLVRISPQLNLRSQQPAIDWIGTADSTEACGLEFRVLNAGIAMAVPVTVAYANGVATFTMAPHSVYNGDVLEIVCVSGKATNLALTARYEIGGAP